MNPPTIKLMVYRKDFGFTMIELMVTMIVLGVLAAIALPSFSTMMAGQRIKSASFDLIAALTMARSEAIKRNVNVNLTPNGGSWLNGWTVSDGTTTFNQQSALSNTLLVSCFAGGGAAAPCPTITYNNNGRLTNAVGGAPAIQIGSANTTGVATRCISIDLSGRPASKKATCP